MTWVFEMLDEVLPFLETHKSFIVSVCVAGFSVLIFRRWLSGGWCFSTASLDGKTVIITGANSGIGKETARDLARRGARVIMACRNVEKGVQAAKDVQRTANGDVVVRPLNLSSMASIRSFAKQILDTESRLDVLINNAGLMCGRQKTQDGFEIQFGTNHLGHFLLTNLLLDLMKNSTPARIVNVSSNVHASGMMQWDDLNLEKETNYSPFKAYTQSKLANILFTKELTRRLAGTGVTAYAVHPGFVATSFSRYMPEYMPWLFIMMFSVIKRLAAKSNVEGAQPIIYCAVDENVENESGHYYKDCHVDTPAPQALDADAAKRLWNESAKMVGLTEDDKKSTPDLKE